ncbi:uncharacterized protein LOC129705926 isoform X2 [Leucoraja erinacea]|uniref:uncharacterized protein LOC129705926 isoform X2 n=1 Tax=Leucoraja erinaceus TaxID=7782 RepID=UPI002458B168|nr:uncharacterized protein LOC129705926 isoform X2 [Leucoraja erinacea]
MAKARLQHTHRDQVLKPPPWIPNTASGLSVICSVNTKNKTAWFEAMSSAYMTRQPHAPTGQKYDQFAWDSGLSASGPSPVTVQQRAVSQRHALPMSIVDRQQSWDPQQESIAPIKLHPLPFDAELACADTLRRYLSDYSWKPGSLPLRRAPSASIATLNRSLSTHSASSPRAAMSNRQLTSKSAAPHLEDLKPVAPPDVTSLADDGLTTRLPTEAKSKPVAAAEAAAYHLHIGEPSSLPQGQDRQEMCMGTDVPSRKNIKAPPDVNKSPTMAQSSSGSRAPVSERGKRAPPVMLSMATASLVSLDTVLEQNESVNNVEDRLYKVALPFEPHPSAPQMISAVVNRKRNKLQRYPKFPARSNTLILPKVVSGTTVAMHQPSRGPSGTRQPLDPPATEGTDRHRQAPGRKPPELQERDSECERPRKMEHNLLVESLKDPLSTAGMWQDGEQQTQPANPTDTSADT